MAIVVDDLRVVYGKTVAVDGVTLEIAGGQCFGLLGPNGAGKTSLMNAIAGIIVPVSGKVHVDAGSRIGIAPQEIALYPVISGRENLRFFGSLNGFQGPRLARRIEEVLELVGLSEHGNKRVSSLSGGMTRRLNFAAAILHLPSIVLLDEPTAGVDPQSRALILDHISEYRSSGATIVYSTHYMEEVERVCDAAAIIDHGKVIACGKIDDLVRAHTRPVLKIRLAGDVDDSILKQINGRKLDASGQIVVEVDDVPGGLAKVLAWSSNCAMSLLEVEIVEGTLENVFLDLTGRGLRDEVGASL